MSSPALDQCSNRRTELLKEITELQAFLRVQRDISHAAGVYGRRACAPTGCRLRRRDCTAASARSQASSVAAVRLAGLALSLDSSAVAAALVVGDAFDM
ncbi:Uncharacterised protein [Mycobacterium tuberculosis]|uniref:Uncharacterized protein n=1 Tax=Mycobacterium tuberculosis TaxID=1773 RepID=A0A655A165_MYCTX|nr:Uncharacterised protein [Mycobacterium tuberculosis]CFS02094.1 Uncharacterised protein [Mycobacterium tuberculosis]CKR59143.1 Uncharacterised protein [Mycobacterium tuberculosis]CKR97436.1 Uncharacterised protein [Mycobacterium tuberculosis]CNY61970.1 Uncharacterised protein [Mycobacterium tuberculosis]